MSEIKLDAVGERVGISVYCTVCGNSKAPHGRAAPMDWSGCTRDQCEGYNQPPLPGCLWPGESESDFGFEICHDATEVRPIRDAGRLP